MSGWSNAVKSTQRLRGKCPSGNDHVTRQTKIIDCVTSWAKFFNAVDIFTDFFNTKKARLLRAENFGPDDNTHPLHMTMRESLNHSLAVKLCT